MGLGFHLKGSGRRSEGFQPEKETDQVWTLASAWRMDSAWRTDSVSAVMRDAFQVPQA